MGANIFYRSLRPRKFVPDVDNKGISPRLLTPRLWDLGQFKDYTLSHILYLRVNDLKASIKQEWEAMSMDSMAKVCNRFWPKVQAMEETLGGN